MAEPNIMASGAIEIKRLRRGYTVQLYFENVNRVAYYQGVDSAGNVAPDWAALYKADKATKQIPCIRPRLSVSGGLKAKLLNGKWYYLSSELTFDANGNCTNSVYSNIFKLSTDGTFTLSIIGNLASKDNTANDSLRFECDAQVAGAEEQHLQNTVDIIISPLGASAWQGTVGYAPSILANDTDKVSLTLQLIHGTDVQKNFKYALVKAGTTPTKADMKAVSTTNGSYSLANAIGRNEVNGQTTFLVYFYEENETDPTKNVDCDGFSVVDNLDDYEIVYHHVNDKVMEIDVGQNVELEPFITNIKTGATITPRTASWKHNVYRLQDGGATWKNTQANVTTKNVTVTTADSDYHDDTVNADVQCNVRVLGDVSFTL